MTTAASTCLCLHQTPKHRTQLPASIHSLRLLEVFAHHTNITNIMCTQRDRLGRCGCKIGWDIIVPCELYILKDNAMAWQNERWVKTPALGCEVRWELPYTSKVLCMKCGSEALRKRRERPYRKLDDERNDVFEEEIDVTGVNVGC